NAGTMYSCRFERLTDTGLQGQLDTKLFGFLRAIRLVIPHMKARRWGRIVNVIGGAGKEPDPYMLGSGIVNSSLLNLTKALSTELGGPNILVNAVCPGWGGTGLWRGNPGRPAPRAGRGPGDEGRVPRAPEKRPGA